MKNLLELGGQTLSKNDIRRLVAATHARLTPQIESALTALPLVGLMLSIAPDANESGLAVELRWMNADGMIDEATNAYPGIVAVRHGYLPVGDCMMGSGDPYFLRLADGVVVRIVHDCVDEDDEELDSDAVEVVAGSISELIELADITGPDRS